MAATIRTSIGDVAEVAHWGHRVPLYHAQQLGLESPAQFADLVEEDRSAAGGAEATLGIPLGPREGPLDVPEELLANRLAETDAQLTATSGPSRRRLWAWMARAISSLPVPVGPSIRTVQLRGATRAIALRISQVHDDLPMISFIVYLLDSCLSDWLAYDDVLASTYIPRKKAPETKAAPKHRR